MLHVKDFPSQSEFLSAYDRKINDYNKTKEEKVPVLQQNFSNEKYSGTSGIIEEDKKEEEEITDDDDDESSYDGNGKKQDLIGFSYKEDYNEEYYDDGVSDISREISSSAPSPFDYGKNDRNHINTTQHSSTIINNKTPDDEKSLASPINELVEAHETPIAYYQFSDQDPNHQQNTFPSSTGSNSKITGDTADETSIDILVNEKISKWNNVDGLLRLAPKVFHIISNYF